MINHSFFFKKKTGGGWIQDAKIPDSEPGMW